MNIKDWPCWAKIGVAVGLAIFVLNWPSTSSEWAAWVQAFGSIGAIAAAIYIMRFQSELSRKEAKEKELLELRAKDEELGDLLEQLISMLSSLIGYAELFRGTLLEFNDRTEQQNLLPLFRAFIRSMEVINLSSFPAIKVYQEVLATHQMATELAEIVQLWEYDGASAEVIEKTIKQKEKTLNGVKSRLKKKRDSIGL